MIYPARTPWRASGDTVPSRVQAGSRFQFAENTGAFNDCGGVRIGGVRSRRPQSTFNDGDGVPEARGVANRGSGSNPDRRPNLPLSTLIAVLTVPAIVVAVGLVWSQL